MLAAAALFTFGLNMNAEASAPDAGNGVTVSVDAMDNAVDYKMYGGHYRHMPPPPPHHHPRFHKDDYRCSHPVHRHHPPHHSRYW